MTAPAIHLRRATGADIQFLSELGRDAEVEPYLSPAAAARERLESLVAEADAQPGPGGLLVIESEAGDPVGGLALAVFSINSRICDLTRLMVDPRVRGRGVGTAAVRLACRRALIEHDFHRLQAETYGDNLAGQRLFDRVGFVREGVRRRAYRRRDRWLDGVLFGILADELRDGSRSGG